MEDLLATMDSLESNVIPSLLSKIDNLESQVADLQNRRQMAEACGLTLTTDGICQVEHPLEILADLTVRGNVTLEGEVDVQGSVNFEDDAVFGGNVKMATTQVDSLEIGSSLQAQGPANFASTVQFAQNARLLGGLEVSGRTRLNELFVRTNLEVRGETTFMDNVKVEGDYTELTVEGIVVLEDDLEVEGETDLLGDVTVGRSRDDASLTVEGELTVKDDTTFEEDVEVEGEIVVEDLTIDGDCAGCNN